MKRSSAGSARLPSETLRADIGSSMQLSVYFRASALQPYEDFIRQRKTEALIKERFLLHSSKRAVLPGTRFHVCSIQLDINAKPKTHCASKCLVLLSIVLN